MMSAVGGGHGAPGGRRSRVGGDPGRPRDVARIGRFAADVLEDLYAVVYGERPVGVNLWCDSSALLMVLRLAGPADIEEPPLVGALPCDAIPELVATAVRAQTGWELAVGSSSVEADLGLAMFVFRIPPGGPPATRLAWRGARTLDDGEPGKRRGGGLAATHVPSWRSWSPVPSGGVMPACDPATERRRLRLLEE
jgi:hypothetical protein